MTTLEPAQAIHSFPKQYLLCSLGMEEEGCGTHSGPRGNLTNEGVFCLFLSITSRGFGFQQYWLCPSIPSRLALGNVLHLPEPVKGVSNSTYLGKSY